VIERVEDAATVRRRPVGALAFGEHSISKAAVVEAA